MGKRFSKRARRRSFPPTQVMESVIFLVQYIVHLSFPILILKFLRIGDVVWRGNGVLGCRPSMFARAAGVKRGACRGGYGDFSRSSSVIPSR